MFLLRVMFCCAWLICVISFFYSLCGIRDAVTFKNVDENIIGKVEEYVKTDLDKVLASWESSGIKIEKSNFYGEMYINSPENFKLSIGDRLQIKELVKYVNEKYDENDVKFSGAYHFLPNISNKPKQKREIGKRYFGSTLAQNVDKSHSPKFVDTPDDECKQKLVDKIIKMYRKHDVIDSQIIDTFTTEMVSIQTDEEGKIRASIKCVLCGVSNKENCFIIRSKHNGKMLSSSGDPYWVLSNYKKHVGLHVKKIIRNLTSQSAIHNLSFDVNANQQIKADVNSCNKRIKISMNEFDESFEEHLSVEYESSIEDYEKDVSDSIEIVEFAPQDNVSLVYADLESLIYTQISTQLIEMQEICLKNNENQLQMIFMVDNKLYTLSMAEIPGDGSCLFRAVDHQINKSKLKTRTQNAATTQLRKRVVAHIKKHHKLFEIELMGSVYEKYDNKGIKIQKDKMKEECNKYLYHELPLSSCWAGSESISAISRLYLVNILIIREDGNVYFSNGFDQNLKKTIILAYCTLPTDERKATETKPNHYNSVVQIEPNDIIELSKRLAVITYNRPTLKEQIEVSD